MTGDPRRWAAEPGIPGVVRVLDPYHGIERGWESAETSLAMIEETMQLEGPQTIAAFILETVVGTNGILIPPDGYLEGVRKLCDKYGILMIADEVMAGFGRTGEWFAVDHWKVVPDLICMAKGLTSSYLPLGAVGMRHHIAQHFQDKVFYGGLTYNIHPMGCAAALATIRVYEEDHLIENAKKMGAIMKQLGAEMQAKHPSVGAVRSIGLFGIFELVRSRKTRQPMAPFNGTSDEMAALGTILPRAGTLHAGALEHVLYESSAVHQRAATARSVRHHRQGAGDHGQSGEGLGSSSVGHTFQVARHPTVNNLKSKSPPSRKKREKGGASHWFGAAVESRKDLGDLYEEICGRLSAGILEFGFVTSG